MRHLPPLTLLLVCLSLALGACQGDPAPPPAQGGAPDVVRWDRDPLNVVFRADIVGGQRDPFAMRNDIPLCTIYGDGRVVWTIDGPSGTLRVLFDFLSDSVISSFISDLSVRYRIYTYEERYPLQIPSASVPTYEQLIVNVNGLRHVTDAYADWEVGYFDAILGECRNLSRTPRQFIPQGIWLSVQPTRPDPFFPTIYWDSASAGVDLGALADGSKRWVEGNLARILWENVIEIGSGVQFVDNSGTYALAVQAPGVMRDSAPAPADGTGGLATQPSE